uniref:Uncharacterized protein n=1 Tax=Gasterosteus aculeatus aculeatus TaxID=481459 RepID=A0AAQ4RYK9_GASAC
MRTGAGGRNKEEPLRSRVLKRTRRFAPFSADDVSASSPRGFGAWLRGRRLSVPPVRVEESWRRETFFFFFFFFFSFFFFGRVAFLETPFFQIACLPVWIRWWREVPRGVPSGCRDPPCPHCAHEVTSGPSAPLITTLSPPPRPPSGLSTPRTTMGQKISGSIKSVDVRGEPSYRPVRRELRGPDFCRPPRLDLLLDIPAASPEAQLRHAWNPDDRSLNVFVKEGRQADVPPPPRWRRTRTASAARWATHGGSTPGRSTGRPDSGAPTPWWAWPPPRPLCTRWATRRWWAPTPSPGAGTWAATDSTTTARTGRPPRRRPRTPASWRRTSPSCCRTR